MAKSVYLPTLEHYLIHYDVIQCNTVDLTSIQHLGGHLHRNGAHFSFPAGRFHDSKPKSPIVFIGYGPGLTASFQITIHPCRQSTSIARDIYDKVLIESSMEAYMSRTVTLTEIERVLDFVNTPNSHESVEDNYTVWCRSLEITVLTPKLECIITDELVIPYYFRQNHKKELLVAVLNHIDKSISKLIQHKLA